MISFRWFHAPKSRSRQLFACVALVGYVASVTGFPLPTPARGTSGSTPFPCQQHQCGCSSAEGCWDDCCCYSLAERVTWAKQNNVELPLAVQLAWANAQYHQAQSHTAQAKADQSHPMPGTCDAPKSDDCRDATVAQLSEGESAAPVKKNCSHCQSDEPTTDDKAVVAPLKPALGPGLASPEMSRAVDVVGGLRRLLADGAWP